MSDDKAKRLEQIAQEIEHLEESPLYHYRQENEYQAVIGEGNPDAAILFIGEAPGKQEATSGRPFVGASGKVLDELLASIELDRQDVYITNVVKDRPPENRDPTKAEIELYTPFLKRQLAIIEPHVIATLGRFAMEFVLKQFGLFRGQKISRAHGQLFAAEAEYGPVQILPLFHPAVALYRRSQKETLLQDFKTLQRFQK